MTLKRELERELRITREEIKLLEIKRSRAESSIILSVIDKKPPSADDIQYFRAFTSQIEVKREQIQKLASDLEKLK